MTRNNKTKSKTYINIVLDKSGSMSTSRQAVISGINEYFANQRNDDVLITLTMFDTRITIPYTARPIKDVPNLTWEAYAPDGLTALYDAIAFTVKAMESEVGPDDRALVVIMTDGAENSSKEYKRDQIVNLIQGKEAQGNWTFVYLGANQDAWEVGSSIGIRQGNTVTYVATAVGTSTALSYLASSTKAYRDGAAPAAFFEEDTVGETVSGIKLPKYKRVK